MYTSHSETFKHVLITGIVKKRNYLFHFDYKCGQMGSYIIKIAWGQYDITTTSVALEVEELFQTISYELHLFFGYKFIVLLTVGHHTT